MSKKRLYLIITLIAIVALGFLLAAFLILGKKSPGEQAPSNPFANFFPFGSKPPPSGTGLTGDNKPIQSPTPNNPTPIVGTQKLSALRQITTVPTAGMFPVIKSGKTSVDYMEKGTGNIYEVKLEDMRRDRISNTVIPRVHEAFFVNGGKSVIVRYLNPTGSIIISYLMEVPVLAKTATNATTTPTVKGKFLASNILDMKVAGDTKSVFALTRSPDFETRTAVGTVYNFVSNTSSDVFKSPFTEWLPVYWNGATALLQTKSSQNVPGHLYSFDVRSGSLRKIIGDVNGLTALPSPDAQKILFSESTRGGLKLGIYSRKDATTVEVPLQTLPEKCVWGKGGADLYCAAPNYLPGGEYPDQWYQGIVSMNDSMWKVDTTTGAMEAFMVPETWTPTPMDITNLMLSPFEDFLFFINKRDSTLWAFQVAGE